MFAAFCLALVVYVEARGEPVDGQMLVAEVALNRQLKNHEALCDVAFKKDQFTGLSAPIDLGAVFADPAWKESVDVAYDAIDNGTLRSGATHYHTIDVNPYWAKNMVVLGMYGNHIFYVEKEEGKNEPPTRLQAPHARH